MIMDTFKLGLVVVTDNDNKICGVITDGDLRHLIANQSLDLTIPISSIMTKNPKTVLYTTPLYDVLNLMESFQITVIPVTDETRCVIGIIHLHDILGKGAFKFSA
jgi:arabinose-5-phosphate isomerase